MSDPKLAKLMEDLERAHAAERAALARLPEGWRAGLRPDLILAALIHQAARRVLAAEVLRYLEADLIRRRDEALARRFDEFGNEGSYSYPPREP